ncbi:MAG: lipopolysaccharide heptosyltransferase II [Nitrospinae bacterium]|nr:lipopolysaccharide heptosyltransferase II [Nitrospinota bacterium]
MSEPKKARRILVRSPNWLGDAIMSLPAIKAIAKAAKPDELRVLCVAGLGNLFMRYPFITDVMQFKKGNASAAHRLLAPAKYDALFLFTNSFRSAMDGAKSKCPVRIGYGGNLRGPLLTHPVAKTAGVHMVDFYLNLVSPFWGSVFSQEIDFPLLPDERAFADGIGEMKGAIGIPLGAKYGPAKCWPHKNLKAFIRLAGEKGHPIALFGSAAEKLQAGALEESAKGRVMNLAGKTTIGEMAAVMKRCAWVVANDSGPLHVAGAVGARTIAIFGPTDHRRTAPLSDNVRIVSKDAKCAPCMKRECPTDHHCMKGISPEEIYAIIAQNA